MSAVNLTLKVITHYGEFTEYNVKNFQKLIGKDVIVAHQLLKNDINQNEYWLVTESFFPHTKTPTLPSWVSWNSSSQETPTGTIAYQYAPLGQLRHELPPDPLQEPDVFNKVKMLSFEHIYDASIIGLFHAAGDFQYRGEWQVGVKRVEEVDHFLPRIGMGCKCIYDSGAQRIYASSYSYAPDHIESSETDDDNDTTVYYTIEELPERKARLKIDYYIPDNLGSKVFFVWKKKKGLERDYLQSMINLGPLAKRITAKLDSVTHGQS